MGRVLITGVPRSGTTFVTRYYQKRGMEFEHEKLGRDGAVSWYHADPNHRLEDQKTFGMIIHLVRHPLTVISSLTTIGDASWQFIEQRMKLPSGDLVQRCAAFYLFWDELAHNRADMRIRVEDFRDEELERAEVNARAHQNYYWADLGKYKHAVQGRALTYGYWL